MLNRLHYYHKHNILAITELWCVQKPQIITNDGIYIIEYESALSKCI
jgi:hypothetical protein